MAIVLGIANISFTDDKIAIKTNFFSDNAGMSVQSPTVELVKSLSRRAVLSLRYSLDRVSLPPVRGIAGIPAPIDGITGASRPVGATGIADAYSKNRNEFIAGLELSPFSIQGYYSQESDYIGRLATVGIAEDFNQKNINLALSFSQGYDDINPTGSGNHYTKKSQAVNLTLTQALSPTSSLRIGADVQRLDGYQSNPYRTVYVGGDHYFERHPQDRLRAAVYMKYNTSPARRCGWKAGITGTIGGFSRKPPASNFINTFRRLFWFAIAIVITHRPARIFIRRLIRFKECRNILALITNCSRSFRICSASCSNAISTRLAKKAGLDYLKTRPSISNTSGIFPPMISARIFFRLA